MKYDKKLSDMISYKKMDKMICTVILSLSLIVVPNCKNILSNSNLGLLLYWVEISEIQSCGASDPF